MRILEGIVQGTQAWLDVRRSFLTASEAPAMMGLSKYKTRTDLLNEKKGGVTADIDHAKQRLFDSGHKAEELTLCIAEKTIGEELFPITATNEVDGLQLLASLDGMNFDGTIIWENKLWNNAYVAQVKSGEVPDTHWPQLEQQLLVTGAEKVLFTVSDGTNFEYLWYCSQPHRKEQLISAWRQFEKDLEGHTVKVITEKPPAEVVVNLPALFVHAKGEITTHNMDAFGAALTTRLAEVRSIVLIDDQDFANAKSHAKKFREVAKEIAMEKERMLAQTDTIGEASRKMDLWAADLNKTALQLEKDVLREDLAKKQHMILSAKSEVMDYINAAEIVMHPVRVFGIAPDFAAAIKGKSKYSSMEDAINLLVAQSKIAVDAMAKDIKAKLSWLAENVKGMDTLLPDIQRVSEKPFDDFVLTVNSRVDRYKLDQAVKIQAEREKIIKEEAENIQREAVKLANAESMRIIKEEEKNKIRAVLRLPEEVDLTSFVRDNPPPFKEASEFSQDYNYLSEVMNYLSEVMAWRAAYPGHEYMDHEIRVR